MIILFNIIFIIIIFFIVWWFWLYKPKAAKLIETGEVTILVENGVYKPDSVATSVGKNLTMKFILKDDAHCAKTVIFPDFDKSIELTKLETVEINITPQSQGEFSFVCPMGMYRGKFTVTEAPSIDITIEGGVYKPNLIHAKLGQPIRMRFTRKDPSRCAESVIFKDFDCVESIPLNEPKTINIIPDKAGTYEFTCEMGMYRGKLIVE